MSVPHVHRFLRTYERLGFMVRDAAGIHLIRRRDLLESWSLRMVDQLDAPVSGAVSEEAFREWLVRCPASLTGPNKAHRVALGVHSAAQAHGSDQVANAPLSIYVEGDPAEVARRLEIDPERSGPRMVELLRPRFPHSFWRGVVEVENDWPVADVVQTYLDLLRHPRRGGEAARALGRRFPDVLGEDG